MYKRFSHTTIFSSNMYRLFAVVGYIVLLSFIYRLVFLFTYANLFELKPFVGDTFLAFLQGSRFDLLLACYFIFPNFVFVFLAAIFKKSIFEKIAKTWCCIAIVLYTALLIGDFYYYSFFGSHFNLLAFGIVDDDTGAVLKSVWTDFPVIRITLFFILLSILECYIVNRIYRSQRIIYMAKSLSAKFLLILFVPLYLLAMRGSIQESPLRQPDAYFSKNQFVNTLTVNGIFSLKTALSEYKISKLAIDINGMLAEAGYLSDKELASMFAGIPIDSITNDPLLYFRNRTRIDTFLRENPPHIVVFQMEGMGLNMMNLHSDSFNVLGKLAEELPHCITYKNFMPSYEGTIVSLEGIITGTAIAPVSGSIHVDKTLLSSGVIPFKQAGYTATFVTGGKIGWRNLDVFSYSQGFDYLEGMETIMADIPGVTEEKEWGVYDEFMFQQIWNRLEDATLPQLIYGMSITNHTPYSVPDSYFADGMHINDSLRKCLLQNEDLAKKCLLSYRYACDYLADFISKVRNSPFAENTIIAITGDHSIKGMVRVDGNNLLGNHGVPLILYVPEKYLENKIVDTTCWGSHKDIFPTLFNLALSGAEYYKLGVDMLSSEASDNIAIGVELATLNKHGAVSNTIDNTDMFYKWDRNSLVITDELTPELQDLQRKNNLWIAVSKYVILRSINER